MTGGADGTGPGERDPNLVRTIPARRTQDLHGERDGGGWSIAAAWTAGQLAYRTEVVPP